MFASLLDTIAVTLRAIASSSTTSVAVLQSSTLGAEAGVDGSLPRRAPSSHTIARRSGSANGSGANRTALTTLKEAATALMPRAIVRTIEMAVNGRAAYD